MARCAADLPTGEEETRVIKSTDFRVSSTFPFDSAYRELQVSLGETGVLAYFRISAFAARERIDGRFPAVSPERLALEAEWKGDAAELIATLLRIGLLSREADGTLFLTTWLSENSYAARADDRKKRARKNNHLGFLKKNGETCSDPECEHAPHKDWNPVAISPAAREAGSTAKGSADSGAPPPSHHSPLTPPSHHSPRTATLEGEGYAAAQFDATTYDPGN
jgi:hypothetical protein